MRPRARILAVGDLLVAADGDTSYAGDDPPDYVAAYTPTSRLCDALTPRRRGGRALDVGTGSGAQALLAARHARAVVATDVNERALEYTRLNAALNGLANVECRLGSWFAPVEGEQFDLITCNAPFVVSPENRWAYRDSGLPADEASARLVQAAAAHLADGGFATLAVSWIAEDEDAPDHHPLEWLRGTGCDSWLLPVWGADPLGHAARWNDHLGDDGRAFGGALDVWTDYLERLGARWVTEGAVLLHRRAGRRHATRVDELDEDALDDAGGQIGRAFANRAALAELTTAQLLERRVTIAMPVVVERELGPRAVAGARVQLLAGTCSDVETTGAAFDLLSSLDGRTTLGAEIEHAGLPERPALSLVRELLELGALELRP